MSYPQKIFLEITTKCNLNCNFCVKNISASLKKEKIFPFALFKKLVKNFSSVNRLILNGIGEPLLHPQLEEFVALAKKHMPATSTIAFQSNGMLFTPEKVHNLLSAGLDQVCLSLDGVEADFLQQKRQGASLSKILTSLDMLNLHRQKINPHFKMGIEFVLMKSNYKQLPHLIELAQEKKVDFILVTHLLPYSKEVANECLFEPNTHKAKEFFNKYKEKAQKLGLAIKDYFQVRWKFHKKDQDKKLINLVETMIKEAEKENILLHLENLVFWDEQDLTDLENILETSSNLARKYNISLDLPPLRAQNKRKCEFVEEKSVFIDVEGNVAPCYFLWHQYSCYMDKRTKHIYPVFFGNIKEEDLQAIWNKERFIQFREEVLQVNYPYCSNCPLVPCDDLLNESFPFEHDCYGNTVPCGHCLWCMGGIRCLR